MRKQFALALGLILIALTSCAYAMQKEDTKAPPGYRSANLGMRESGVAVHQPQIIVGTYCRLFLAYCYPERRSAF